MVDYRIDPQGVSVCTYSKRHPQMSGLGLMLLRHTQPSAPLPTHPPSTAFACCPHLHLHFPHPHLVHRSLAPPPHHAPPQHHLVAGSQRCTLGPQPRQAHGHRPPPLQRAGRTHTATTITTTIITIVASSSIVEGVGVSDLGVGPKPTTRERFRRVCVCVCVQRIHWPYHAMAHCQQRCEAVQW